MSSRIRYVLAFNGGHSTGSVAITTLAAYGPVETLDDLKRTARVANARIYLFREPRRIKKARSRYKRLCNALGIRAKQKPCRIEERPQPMGRPLDYRQVPLDYPLVFRMNANAVLNGVNAYFNAVGGQNAAPQQPELVARDI